MVYEITKDINTYPNDQGYMNLRKMINDNKPFDKVHSLFRNIYLDTYKTLKKEYDILWEPYYIAREKEYGELRAKYGIQFGIV